MDHAWLLHGLRIKLSTATMHGLAQRMDMDAWQILCARSGFGNMKLDGQRKQGEALRDEKQNTHELV